MTNVVVLSFAGTVGKTSLTKHVVVPLLGDAERIQIESINDSASGADTTMTARNFQHLAEKLAATTRNCVIDIGGSNVESVLKQMGQMGGIEEEIQWWVIPVDDRTKVMNDTLNTIEHLINKQDVDPAKIVVIANNVEFPEEVPKKFASILAAAAQVGFHFAEHFVPKSDLFDLTKDSEMSIIEMAADTTDFRALVKKEDDPKQRAILGRLHVQQLMAKSLSKTLRALWHSTPMANETAAVE